MNRQANAGEDAEGAVRQDGQHDGGDPADHPGKLAGLDRIRAERGTNGAFLDNRQLCRQRTRAQLDGQLVCRFDREVAADLPGAAEDRLADHRRRDHLIVEHDGKRAADVVLGEVAELARPRIIEGEGDHRFVGALIEGGLGAGQLIAAHDRRLAQQQRALAPLAVERGVDPVAGRNARLLGLLRRDAGMHLVEAQPRGLADQLLERGGILQARHLHEDARASLADDGRLGGAERIDAAAYRFDRRADGISDAALQACFGRSDDDQSALGLGQLDVGDGGAHDTGLLHQATQFAHGGIGVLRLGEPYLNRVVGDAEARKADLGVAQALARIVAQCVEPILAHIRGLHGEQQVGAATQVEAEVQLGVREPARPGIDRLPGEEIGNDEQHADDADENDGGLLPGGKLQHGGLTSI